MKKLKVPFYANPDDTHCYQAVLGMVLEYFKPGKKYSWKELEKLTDKQEGFWTWDTRGLINLHKTGFKLVVKNTFDPVKFAKEGKRYMVKKYGKKIADISVKHTKDLKKEQKTYEEFARLNLYTYGHPDFNEIKKFIDKGYLVVCHVNGRMLHGKSGYSGHFVLVTGYDDKGFYVNDPGPIGRENRKVPYDFFLKVWGNYSKDDTRNLYAFKLR